MAVATRPQRGQRIALGQFRELNVLIALILLCLYFYWRQPETFIKPANLAVIMRFMATFGVLAIGEILVIITGGIDLSVGSLTALTGVIVATLMLKGAFGLAPVGMIPAILITLALGTLVGVWHGLFVTKLKIPPFIITLSTWLIARGMAGYITRGYPIVYPSGHPFLALGQGDLANVPISFIILIVVALIVSFILNFTVLGRHIYAVGGNLEAARVSGVHVDRVRIFCYATSGFMAAMTGILLASRLGQGTPTVGTAYELWAIAATVIGGTSLFGGEGTVLGALLGAAIMGVMQNGMVLINISSYLQDAILGVVLAIAVIYDMVRRRTRR
ncbi:MAG: ABC transporter permease [Anaerolineae bacterium]|nr:ABC transporter permease [Anaerolineae bacterium]MDW8100788.1 ABC transporter permease [Anaerolineae bacterium]